MPIVICTLLSNRNGSKMIANVPKRSKRSPIRNKSKSIKPDGSETAQTDPARNKPSRNHPRPCLHVSICNAGESQADGSPHARPMMQSLRDCFDPACAMRRLHVRTSVFARTHHTGARPRVRYCRKGKFECGCLRRENPLVFIIFAGVHSSLAAVYLARAYLIRMKISFLCSMKNYQKHEISDYYNFILCRKNDSYDDSYTRA